MGHPFDTKRRFKRGMQIILILFVSLFISISCGIPSYFYMYGGSSGSSSSYYYFTEGEESGAYIDTYDMVFKIDIGGDTNSSVSAVDGPSLVYLYTIVPMDLTDTEITSISKKFKSKFSSDYINGNTGRPISSSTKDVMNITYDTDTYTMHKFSLYNSNNNTLINMQSPTAYGFELNPAVKDTVTGIDDILYSSSFGFLYNHVDDDSSFELLLYQTDDTDNDNFKATDDDISDAVELRMYNKSKFSQTADSQIELYPNIDSGDSYKIIVYSALNVSTGDGFTNIFWSTLQEVGNIPSKGL